MDHSCKHPIEHQGQSSTSYSGGTAPGSHGLPFSFHLTLKQDLAKANTDKFDKKNDQAANQN